MTGRSNQRMALALGIITLALSVGERVAAVGVGHQPCPAPPPCSPDGVCWPRRETWGWYPTRWRMFPGDYVSQVPSDAAPTPADDQPEARPQGPLPPGLFEEGQAGPAPPARSATGEDAAVPDDLLDLPGPGPVEPPADQAEQPEAAEEGPAQPAPGAEEPPLGDPFGSAPPQPPAWMMGKNSPAEAGAPMFVQPAVAFEEPPVTQFDGPNLHGDDAPPMLPSALRPSVTTGQSAAPAPLAARANIQLSQPLTVKPIAVAADAATTDRRIVPAAAQMPVGIQLINPATAASAEVSDSGLQQAVYFEATDIATDAQPVALPSVK